MPALKGGGKTLNRQPSLKGSLVFYISNGQFYASPWPKKRGKPKSAVTRAQNEWFRQAQWATKYWPAQSQLDCAKAVAGTALLPRDLMTMIMAGRCYMLTFKDGRKMYSKQMVSDVSQSLDVIAQEPGSMMFRGPQYWQPVLPGAPGNVPVVQDDGVTIAFSASAGGAAGGSGIPSQDWQTASDLFSAGFYGGAKRFYPSDTNLNTVCFFSMDNEPSATITPAIYSSTESGGLYDLLATGDTVTGIVSGLNRLPLSAPLRVTRGEIVHVGFVLQGASIHLAAATINSVMYFSTPADLPPENGPLGGGNATWGSMWAE